MKRGMYLWQANGMAERTVEEIVATLRTGGVSELRWKAGQYTTWEGHFDHGGAWSLNSAADVELLAGQLGDAGISSYPWIVPMGLAPAAEAAFAATVAAACGRLDLDVEPGSQFWSAVDRADYSAVVPYFSELRDRAGSGVELTLDFPGKWAWTELTPLLRLAEPYVDRFAIQSYFGPMAAAADEARLRQITSKPIDHIADVARLGAMLDWLSQRGLDRVWVWDAAHMTAAAYALLAAHPDTGSGVEWQAPGFAELRLGHPEMGDALGAPYSDAMGNVWQNGRTGRALWLKDLNRNYWLPAE